MAGSPTVRSPGTARVRGFPPAREWARMSVLKGPELLNHDRGGSQGHACPITDPGWRIFSEAFQVS